MDESLAASYGYCRALHRVHGRTYYLATRLLPAWKRPHVHALYGFTRYTDDIVDRCDPPGAAGTTGAPVPAGGATVRDRAERLAEWTGRFTAALDGAPVDDPVLPAVLHTIATFDLDRADLTAFLRSMRMDLTVSGYDSYDDLLDYMAGSAAAIGSMMLPILGSDDPERAREPARELGLAFQLTNFIRDVAEDLARGRIYLPRRDLARFGVTPEDLCAASAAGTAGAAGAGSGALRDLIAFEIGRAREHYARAAPGIGLLAPTSRACIRAAYLLYGGILDEVVRQDYDVFRRRATVPARRRLAVAAGCLLTPPGRPVPVPGGGARVPVMR